MSLDRFEGTFDSQAPIIVLTPENGTLTVPDGSLLFAADFQRDGHDLLLVNEGAPTIRVEDYFLSDPPASIHAPNGSQLTGEIVARLAGPIAPGQYAQAGASQRGGDPIGQVETIDGVATVQRVDGTVEDLSVGMKIFQNDVVETDAGGSVSLTFADGTIFTLASASRMVIDSLIYDPASTENSASFSLVQGSFVFIAGQVAKTGGMDVNTPSATMGIRGTTVLARIETVNGAITTQVTLVRDANGDLGRVELRGLDGSLIQTIEVTDTRWEVTTEDGETFSVERSPVDENDDRALIADAVLAAQSAANRVAAGNTFVTLPSTSGAPGADGPQVPGQLDAGEDVDGLDEPIIDDLDDGPAEGGSDGGGGGFDEAASELLQLQAGDLTVQGQEDAGEDGGISGTISVGAPGNFTFEIISGPQNGTATIDENGNFTYVPDENFNGTDSFSYQVTDDQGDQGTGTVFVEVEPVNDPPELDDTSTSAPEDGVLVGSLAATDIDGDPLTYSLLSGPSNGTVTVLEDGSYSYVPDEDFEGEDSFVVQVADEEGATDTATVFVNVTPVNDAPVVTTPEGGDTGTIQEDGEGDTVSGQLTASDPDLGDSLTWSGSQSGEYGDLVVEPNGEWTYTIDPEAADPLIEGEEVVETFEVTVQDSEGATATTTVDVLVIGTNDAATISGDATGDVGEDGTQQTSGTLSTSDEDTGEAEVQPLTDEPGDYGTFTIDAAGNWTYTLENENAEVQALPAGDTLTDTFTVTSEDGTDTQDVVITITGTNDAATISGDATGDVGEDGTQQATGTLSTSDEDTGEAEVQPLTDVPGDYGTFTIDAAGNWTYTLENENADVQALPAGDTLTDTFTVTSEDGTDTQDVVITITGTDDAATIGGQLTGDVIEDTTLTETGTVTISDTDTGEEEVVPQTDTVGSFGTFSILANGDWTYNLNNSNATVQQLAQGEELTDTFTVTSTDTGTTESVVITITGTNDDVVITSQDLLGAVTEDDVEGETETPELTDSGVIGFSDVDLTDTHSASVSFTSTTHSVQLGVLTALVTTDTTGVGTGGEVTWSFSVDNDLVQFLGAGETITEVYTVSVTDNEGSTVTRDVEVTITGTNDEPVIDTETSDLSADVPEGTEATEFTGQMVSDDVDETDGATWSVVSEGEDPVVGTYGTFTISASGEWTYTLTESLEGLNDPDESGVSATETFTVQVSDGNGGIDTQVITINLLGDNDLPVVDLELSEVTGDIVEDGPVTTSGQLEATDVDGPAESLVWRLPNEEGVTPTELTGTYGTLTITAAGVWTYTLTADVQSFAQGATDQDVFTVEVFDGIGTTQQQVTVTITGTNDDPVIDAVASDLSADVLEGAEDTEFTGQMVSDDVDVGDGETWSVVSEGEDPVVGTYGTFTISASGEWTYTLTESLEGLNVPDESGVSATETFTVQVSDGNGGVDTQVITINLIGENDGPVFDAEASVVSRTIIEDDTPDFVTGQLVASDVDGPTPTWSTQSGGTSLQGTYGILSITAAGLWTYTLDPVLSNGLGPEDLVDETFTLKATDSNGAEITQEVTVSVQGTNDAPIISPPGAEAEGSVTEDAEDNTTSGQLSAIDPEGDTVIWGIQGSVEGSYGVLSIDQTGAWTYTLDNAAADILSDGPGGGATETFFVTVTDTAGDPTPQTIEITIDITGNNDDPRVPDSLVIENLDGEDVVDGTLTAFDPEGEAVSFAGLSGGAPVTSGISFTTANNGTVTVDANGDFIYEPDEGFVGFDSFDYRATDASGNFTDGTATIAVENAGGEGDPVAITFNQDATDDVPAGSLTIDAQEIVAQRVNIVFAIDGSGSVSSDDWDAIKANIEAALLQLEAAFAGSNTIVTVGFTVFAGSATEVISFNLVTDDWESALAALDQPNGATNWYDAIENTEEFLDSPESPGGAPRGQDASNFLFVITDGEPTTGPPWRNARDSLLNESANGYTVSIDAFGIGSAFNADEDAQQNLEDLDTDPVPPPGSDETNYTLLETPSQLEDALTAEPVFNPTLVDLTLTLSVDGGATTTLNTVGALVQDGIDYQLDFAKISGLADLLGNENRFSITANYDLDGDGVSDLTLFSTDVLGKADTAQNISGAENNGADLLFGSDLADTISGDGGDDILVGYDGADILIGGAGADTVLAGAGDDRIVIEDLADLVSGDEIDAGDGRDVLGIDGAGMVDLSLLSQPGGANTGIEVIDLENGEANQISLTVEDVVDTLGSTDTVLEGLSGLTGPLGNTATIYGDTGDTYELINGPGGTWNKIGTFADPSSSEDLIVYQYVESGTVRATVAIDDDIVPAVVT